MNDEQYTQQIDEKFVVVGTKLSRQAVEQMSRIARAKNMTIYEMIQMVCDTLIRYMDDRHNLSEDMERAMAIFEHMVGWANALNLADPTVNKEVAQAVYILQDGGDQHQPNKKRKSGFRAVMVSKPFMGIWDETNNVMDIFERIFNICMPELFAKLYRARVILGCERVSEVINMLCDAQIIEQMNMQYRQEFEDASRADNGRPMVYGNKAKQKKRRTPDSLAGDNRIKFHDWEGEHRQTDIEPPSDYDHDLNVSNDD